jgi:hypothetical protein
MERPPKERTFEGLKCVRDLSTDWLASYALFRLEKQQVRAVLNWTRRTMDQQFDAAEFPDDAELDLAPGDDDATTKPWFPVDRGTMQDPLFGETALTPKAIDPKRRAWTYAEAWTFGIEENASFRRRVVRDVNGNQVVLEAGQLLASRRYLARKFNWSESAVRVFLGKLAKAGKIAFSAQPAPPTKHSQGRSQGSNVLTVSDQRKFQRAPKARSQGRSQPPSKTQPKENNKIKQPPYPQRGPVADFDGRKLETGQPIAYAAHGSNAPWFDDRKFLDGRKQQRPRIWLEMIERETRDGHWPEQKLGPSPANEPTAFHDEIDEHTAEVLRLRGLPAPRQIAPVSYGRAIA